MYIAPDTDLYILTGCPLVDTYEHTVYFYNASDQATYFSGLTKYSFNALSYQRVNKGVIRVEKKADDLYDCNYLMFRNSAFGSKWFYAFITKVEYINNITSEITYKIDVMQTWHFDYELGKCFVEREHSTTDRIGENTVPENLETGEYVSDHISPTPYMDQYHYIVAATFDEDYEDYGGGVYSGLFQGLRFNDFSNASDASAFILGAGAKADGIVSLFAMPWRFAGGEGEFNVTIAKHYSDIDGYVPRNKKLFVYPYNFLYVTNNQGNSATFNYEDFSNATYATFRMIGDFCCNPAVMFFPTNYKGVVNNIDERLVITGFPQLAYATDSFKAWLAQNSASLGVNTIGGVFNNVMGAIGSGATGNVLGMVSSIGNALTNVASSTAQVYEHSKMPDQAHNASGGNNFAGYGYMDFFSMDKHIKAEYARIIDDFFDMFGYATHRLKVPNRMVRPHWTYTKTANCVITGSVPSDDESEICKVYNNGVTFWRYGSEVGNYALDNRWSGDNNE